MLLQGHEQTIAWAGASSTCMGMVMLPVLLCFALPKYVHGQCNGRDGCKGPSMCMGKIIALALVFALPMPMRMHG